MNLQRAIKAQLELLPAEQLREWRAAHGLRVDSELRRVTLARVSDWTTAALGAVSAGAYEWCCAQRDACDVMIALAKWDRRIAAHCAAQVARTTLSSPHATDPRPLRAIEAVERWVRGEATVDECRVAANASAYAAFVSLTAANAAASAAKIAVFSEDAARAQHAAIDVVVQSSAGLDAPAFAERRRALCVLCGASIRDALDAVAFAQRNRDRG